MTGVAPGQELEPETSLVTPQQISDYAAASGDTNPIHLDDDAARRAGLDGIIAHGMYTFGLLGTVAQRWAEPELIIKHIGGRFVRVVRPGDALTFRAIVVRVDADLVRLDVSVVNQHGEPVMSKCVVALTTRRTTERADCTGRRHDADHLDPKG